MSRLLPEQHVKLWLILTCVDLLTCIYIIVLAKKSPSGLKCHYEVTESCQTGPSEKREVASHDREAAD